MRARVHFLDLEGANWESRRQEETVVANRAYEISVSVSLYYLSTVTVHFPVFSGFFEAKIPFADIEKTTVNAGTTRK